MPEMMAPRGRRQGEHGHWPMTLRFFLAPIVPYFRGLSLGRLLVIVFAVVLVRRPLHVADVMGMFVIGGLAIAKDWREFRQAGEFLNRTTDQRTVDALVRPPLPLGPTRTDAGELTG